MSLYKAIPRWIIEIPNHLKTKEMCIETVRIEPLSLAYDPYNLTTQEMCEKAVEKG